MVSLLVVAHAPLASAFCAVAAHTFPQCGTRLHGVDVLAEWDLDQATAAIQRMLPPDGPVLVLIDVPCATPANAALRAVEGRDEVALVHGLNVPMLWRSLCYAEDGLDALVQRALEGAQRGVGQVGVSKCA